MDPFWTTSVTTSKKIVTSISIQSSGNRKETFDSFFIIFETINFQHDFITMNNTKKRIGTFLLSLAIGSTFAQKTPVDYVDCFIGTSNSRWMLGPYAQRPFGMVQLGPDNQGNKWMGGYEYAINSISGFSHLHAWTMGGLTIMPATADLSTENPGPDSPYLGANAGYHSRIMKNTEKASPGYYEAELYDHQVKAEITTTTRCGFQRYTFPECQESRILIDLLFPTEWDYGFKVNDARITKLSDTELEGYADCQSGNWSSWNDWKLFFVIRFSRPFETMNGWTEGKSTRSVEEIRGKNDTGAYVTFHTTKGEVIQVQSGLSLVSAEGARENLKQELDPYNWNFDKCAADARNEWNNLLSKIQIEGGSETDRIKFYTNLYRAYTGKQTWNDADGKYRDACENVQQLQSGQKMYGGDAFWNSYWNLNGLWSIITPEIIDNWVTTQLEMYKHTGWTGKGPAGIEYSGIMEGSHETALMVAAFQKGIRKDGEEIYKAVYKNVTEPGITHPCGGGCGQPHLEAYIKYGYMPAEIGVVSKTLDYAYDDYCVGSLARTLGKKKEADYFLRRAQNYKNVFHPDHKFVSRKDSTGKWDEHFDPFSNNGFIEGNSWQYSWYVPHDTEGLIRLIGKEKALDRLEEGFEKSRKHRFTAHAFDRTNGQSAEYYINQGNEVNMSSPFLFNYMGKPALCQKYSREILDSFYGSTPYRGWGGDEDEGQLGSWFVMSAIGLFEMDGGVAGDSQVEITSPLFNKITLNLNDQYYTGKQFIIEARNNSPENIYIQSATLNGKPLKEPRFPFKEIQKGGTLLLEMGNTPNDNLWTK